MKEENTELLKFSRRKEILMGVFRREADKNSIFILITIIYEHPHIFMMKNVHLKTKQIHTAFRNQLMRLNLLYYITLSNYGCVCIHLASTPMIIIGILSPE